MKTNIRKAIRLETEIHGISDFQNTKEGIEDLNSFILMLRLDEKFAEKYDNTKIEFTYIEEGADNRTMVEEFYFVDELVKKIKWIGFKNEIFDWDWKEV